MNELKKRRAAGESGFTLIELLVVIAILAVLAGVVVFSLSGAGDNGQESACEIQERTLETAIAAYRAEETSYPTAMSDLVPTYISDAPDPDWHEIDFAATPPAVSATAGGDCV